MFKKLMSALQKLFYVGLIADTKSQFRIKREKNCQEI